MAVSLRHLPFVRTDSYRAWWKVLAGWVSGVHPTFTGLSWAVVEADDGNTRAIPSGGTTVDHLPGGHLWRSDVSAVPPIGSWTVLRSQPGVIPPHNQFEFLIYLSSETRAYIRLFPVANFATNPGGSAGGEPVLPAELVSFTSYDIGANSRPRFYAAGDQSCLMMGWLDEGRSDVGSFFYLGELDVPVRYGSPVSQDPYPFVLRNSSVAKFTKTTHNQWLRVDPTDSTVVRGGSASDTQVAAKSDDNLLAMTNEVTHKPYNGALSLLPLGVVMEDTFGMVNGYLRHCWGYHPRASSYGTTEGNRHFLIGGDLPGMGIAIRWDESTGV